MIGTMITIPSLICFASSALRNRSRVFTLATVLALSAAAQAQIFSNNTSQIPQGSPFNNSATENVDFADVDGDGDYDAVFADGGDFGNDQNRIWINNGSGTFTDETSTRLPALLDDSRDVDFVDFDHDGDPDIYVSNTSAIANQTNRFVINMGGAQGGTPGFFQDQTATRWINIAVNNGTTFSSIAPGTKLVAGGFIDWSCDCSFADLDNDGDIDLVPDAIELNVVPLLTAMLIQRIAV